MGFLSRFTDGLQNVITGLGTRADTRSARRYAPTYMTQVEIEAAYRGSAMLRKAIAIPALDMVREWRDWQADKPQIEAIEAEERRLGIQGKVRQAEVLRGLGGGAFLLGLPGDPAMPANLAAIRKGQLAFVHVVSRYALTLGDMVQDAIDPLYGGPAFFRLNDGSGDQRRLHPSRVICFKGEPLPLATMAGPEDAFWGEGRVPALDEPAKNLDEALASFAALIKDAKNIDIGVAGLLDQMATTDGEARLMKRLGLMVEGSSFLNANVFDLGTGKGDAETITRHQTSWAGVRDMVLTYAEAFAAAADIPMTRLWGISPGGLNSTGKSDDANWNKMVVARQTLDLRPCLDALDAALIPSALGSRPAEVWWKFSPLDTPSEKEDADTFNVTMQAAEKLQATGSIPDQAFARGMQNLMSERGWMPGLDGALADIPEAERFGLSSKDDGSDPSELQARKPEPVRRAVNDKVQEVGVEADRPFVDAKRRSKAQRLAGRSAASSFNPNQPRDRHGRWIPSGVRSLLQRAATGQTSGGAERIGTVGERLTALARRGGIAIRSRDVVLDPSLTRHAIIRHGAEGRRGQKSLSAGDIAAAATTVNAARSVRRVQSSKQGVDRFATVTRAGRQQIVGIYENRKKGLTLVTMWVRE